MDGVNGRHSVTSEGPAEASLEVDSELGHPADRLARFGLEVTYRGESGGWPAYAIRGNTFPLNDCLEAAGGRWDSDQEAWLFDGENALQKLIAQIEAADVIAFGPGLNEQAAAFEGFAPKDPLLARFLDAGPLAIDDSELLQIFLGFSDRFSDSAGLSRLLIERFGSLSAILAADPHRLAELDHVSGRTIGLLKAVQLAIERVLHEPVKESPVIGSWEALTSYLKVALRHKTTEHLVILFLDRKNRLIREEVHQRGTVDHTPLYPREIVKRALELAASAIILVHNHPSGDPTPSKADIEMTRQVIRALDCVDITLHDHVIVGLNSHLSLRAQRLL